MCVGCAMAAATGASGLRSWLQAHHFGWLTPPRLRRLTLAAMAAAALVSSVGLSGSAPTRSHAATPAAHPLP